MFMMRRGKLLATVAAAVLLAAGAALRLNAAQDRSATADAQTGGAQSSPGGKGRFYEMRTYHCAEGKLEDLHNRFRNHTNRLFKKHGIEMVGCWTAADAPASQNTLVFILAYPSREAREQLWNAFINDPEWKKAAAESERNGKLVTKADQLFMNPTDYSPAK
jgi:uncharacterized protein YbaA (DUF1428 family)